MNFDLQLIPTTFDMLHAGLTATSLLFLIIAIVKKGKTTENIIEKPIEKIITIEKPVEKIVEVEKVVEVEKIVEKVVEIKSNVISSPTDSALQLLSIFQKEARLIDFFHEDVSAFSDEEVGAAARVIHSGGVKVLNEYISLCPIMTQDEESNIVVPEGFNSQEIRLSGNIVGHAPFNGTLIHKGWKASRIELPKIAKEFDSTIIAPAEVEL